MNGNTKNVQLQSTLINDRDFLKKLATSFLQNIVEEQFSEHIGASPYERSQDRSGYRNGYYSRQLKTRVGSLELFIPRDREGIFRTELFERYQRSEKAFVLALAEMYINGVSTRKVSNIVEELCGHSISKSQVSELSKCLDQNIEEWRSKPLDNEYAYLQLDAIYHKVREGGRVNSVANYIAVGVRKSGVREVIGSYIATNEYKEEWKNFLRSLKDRGMNTPDLVVSDDHDGLRQAIVEELPSALWQRCQVHYMRNFLCKQSRKSASETSAFLKSVFLAEDFEAAKISKETLLNRLRDKGQEPIADWIEETIDDSLNVLNIPRIHRRKMKSTNMIERLNGEIRRRTNTIRIFPNRASCDRIVTSVCLEQSDGWEGRRYLNFEDLK